jgi:hypothetical protein
MVMTEIFPEMILDLLDKKLISINLGIPKSIWTPDNTKKQVDFKTYFVV